MEPREVVHWLGYRLPSATVLRQAGGRWFVGGPETHLEWAELDDHLGQRAVVAPPEAYGPYLASLPIDAHHGVALVGAAGQLVAELVRYTFGGKQTEPVLSNVGTRIEFEEASHLLAVDTPSGATFFRVDAKTGALGPPITTSLQGKVYLVDPARAQGRIGIMIDEPDTGSVATVTPIRALCDACPGHVRLGRPQHVTLDYGDRGLIEHDHDLTQVADLAPVVRTSPDGASVVSFAGNRVTLRAADGSVRWVAAVPGVRAVAWTASGELVALAGGAVRLDVDTGERRDRHCGWLFGLSNDPSFDGPSPVVCDAP